jgi:predicted dehydrogenase
LIADTPGFSAFDADYLASKEEIQHLFPDFGLYLGGCRFLDCAHIREPECAILEALEAGKAVLCEKPVAVNVMEMNRIADCARKNNTFFMEGMWTRFFPVNRAVKELIDSGKTGQVTLIEVDFGFGSWNNGITAAPDSRLFSPELAGGSLLDVGVYTASYCDYMKNGMKPVEIKALASMVDTGVDGMAAYIMKYPDGSLSIHRSAIVQDTRQSAMIYCEKCTIEVHKFWCPVKADIKWIDGKTESIEVPLPQGVVEGYHYECIEVKRCLDAGLKESPLMTLNDSIRVMEQLDSIRSKIGLKYPFE